MCNAGLFCVSEGDTRQKLLRTVKKEVGVYSWTRLVREGSSLSSAGCQEASTSIRPVK